MIINNKNNVIFSIQKTPGIHFLPIYIIIIYFGIEYNKKYIRVILSIIVTTNIYCKYIDRHCPIKENIMNNN
jgi:hypothetical protein